MGSEMCIRDRGKVEKLDLDILARICYVLDCEVSELLEYRADAE